MQFHAARNQAMQFCAARNQTNQWRHRNETVTGSIFEALAKWGRVLSNPFEIKNFVHSTAVFILLLQIRL